MHLAFFLRFCSIDWHSLFFSVENYYNFFQLFSNKFQPITRAFYLKWWTKAFLSYIYKTSFFRFSTNFDLTLLERHQLVFRSVLFTLHVKLFNNPSTFFFWFEKPFFKRSMYNQNSLVHLNYWHNNLMKTFSPVERTRKLMRWKSLFWVISTAFLKAFCVAE